MSEHNWVHHLDKCTHECLYCGLEITDRTLVNARGAISPCEVSDKNLQGWTAAYLPGLDEYIAKFSGWGDTTEEEEGTCICFAGRSRFCGAHDDQEE